MQEFYLTPPPDLIAGTIRVCHDGHSVLSVELSSRPHPASTPTCPLERELLSQFRDYFQHPEHRFSLPLTPAGTPFQQRVWSALQQIPSGRVMTYGELAVQLGSSARAVGNACRHNPIAIVIPCHRVVARQGIGGYSGATAGAEVGRKRRLLHHEGVER